MTRFHNLFNVFGRRQRTGRSSGQPSCSSESAVSRSTAGQPADSSPARPLGTVSDRGVSPVVGAVLLVAITVALAALAGTLFLDLGDSSSPAPSVSLALEPAESAGATTLVHEQGAVLDGGQVELRGVVDANALAGRELAAGESVTVNPTGDTVSIVWFEPEGDASYVIAELDVPDTVGPSAKSGGPDALADLGGDVFTTNASGVLALEGDGGDVGVIANTDDVAATGGATTDIDGDGDREVPYVNASGAVKVVDAGGNTMTIADGSGVSGSVETDKTRIAAGTWDGSPDSVFFVDENHDRLLRAAPGGSTVTVATPSDGAQAVLGVDDVDGDGTDELVFTDASQQVRYLDPDGSGGTDVREVPNAQAGSNNGVGAGTLADLDGDGTPAIIVIDGSNNIVISREPSGGGTETVTLNDEADEAAKAPLTAADVDDDGALEIVYVTSSDGGRVVKYVDDVGDANALRVLNDDDGDAVIGSDETGGT